MDGKKVDMRTYVAVLVGAMASSWVGTMYGYSYLKDNIKEWWKSELPVHEVNDALGQIDFGYFSGFTGQYFAIIPGLVFDAFGVSITCLYGCIVCASGFFMVGYAARYVAPTFLVGGLFLAGQGSKGLGFGALLGTIRMIPDSWAAGISGLYLMLDALSSIFAMEMYDRGFEPAKGEELETGLAPALQYFFCTLATIILTVGVVAAVVYYLVSQPKEEDAQGETAGRASVMSTASARPRNSIVEEAMRTSQYGSDALKRESQLDIESEGGVEEAQPKTFWLGVVCCFVVMFLSEAQGLAFNKEIGDAFKASREAKVGLVTPEQLSKGTYPSLFNELAHSDVLTSSAKTIRENIIGFYKVPSQVKIEKKTDLQDHAANTAKKGVEVTLDNSRKVQLFDATPADDVVILECSAENGGNLTLKNFETGVEVFNLFYKKDCKFADNEFSQLIKKTLAGVVPVAGLQVHGEGIKYVAQNDGKQTFDPETGIARAHHSLTATGSGDVTPEGFKKIGLTGVIPPLFRDGSRLGTDHPKQKYGAGVSEVKEAPKMTKFMALSPVQLVKKLSGLPFVHFATGWKSINDNKAVSPEFHNQESVTRKIDVEANEPLFFDPTRLQAHSGLSKDLAEVQEEGDKLKLRVLKNGGAVVASPEDIQGKLADGVEEIRKKNTEKLKDLRIVLVDKSIKIIAEETGTSHANVMKSTKKNLTRIFSLGNAFGRLGLGILAGIGEKATPWMPCATWLVAGCVLYTAIFSAFGFLVGVPSTTDDSTETPMSVFLMTAVVALVYGGVFTINTAYLKKVVAPNQLGLVLGMSLLVLAAGATVFGKYMGKIAPSLDKQFVLGEIGEKSREPFFQVAVYAQLLAFVPALVCWYAQAKDAKEALEEAASPEEKKPLVNRK